MSRVILLWSGGKDAMQALCHAREAGHQVAALVTFAPPAPRFLAHPLSQVRRQAAALALPHRLVTIEAPFDLGYERALAALKEEWQLDGVVTGDIDSVGGAPNWIRERCRPLGLTVHTPLWQQPREALLADMLARGIVSHLSCVDTRVLAPEWVGRRLDATTLAELQQLAATRGLDACGEQGEYHTMVTDGPGFAAPLTLGHWQVARQEHLAYLQEDEE
ncbi:adenine nucleotide alpha hydrolase [Aeromonas caviae]|uniref:adenine nucleotide alpha hydrolase n=1 Tax=Aeromonas caviae TaxID=648 RepID=UPI0021D04036|nr:adenine nucleotide alpha hydrolase [Aeromonas caviae]MCU7791945.1 adenine nucleotide alpha hydrolase [Aeromonas caviae]WAF58997.1 adenine nucleotide alpha hydrolase [Aeromonas caviae]WAF63057.1 adenine nucleotide alpha hydrolase [Aeromonas caviae]WAF79894.1 adenine nucleotide alpha hydrolase [Aeromonas caviae]